MMMMMMKWWWSDDDDPDPDPDPYPSTDADSDTETETDTDTDTDSDTDEHNDKDDTSGCAMMRIAIVLLVMFACTARAMIELDNASWLETIIISAMMMVVSISHFARIPRCIWFSHAFHLSRSDSTPLHPSTIEMLMVLGLKIHGKGSFVMYPSWHCDENLQDTLCRFGFWKAFSDASQI